MASNNNETVHISLGTTANYISSHLLNLQGLAATTSASSSSGGNNNQDDVQHQSLCDPSVTHDIASIDTDDYATHRGTSSSSSASRYMYVPRALIVDGRDAFGSSWGGVSRNNNYNSSQYQPSRVPTSSNDKVPSSAWDGAVSIVNKSDHDLLFGNNQSNQHQHQHNNDSSTATAQQSAAYENNQCHQHQHQHQHQQQYLNERGEDIDPLYNYHNAASIMGLSPQHSRFNATAARPTMSYNTDSSSSNSNSNSRHVQWDDNEEENEEENEEDAYGGCGYNNERRQEEKRRQLEQMEYQNQEAEKNWNMAMEDAWEEAFYNKPTTGDGSGSTSTPTSLNANAAADNTSNAEAVSSSSTTISHTEKSNEREIQWHDYWMPPRPSPTKYQIPLPFDTTLTSSGTTGQNSNSNSMIWSTSFNMGYHPGPGDGGSILSGGMGGGNNSEGITQTWREHVLSESLRKVLESCDVVKGFNIFVDGGSDHYSATQSSSGLLANNTNNSGSSRNNKHAKAFSNVIAGGGGFHAGLATSLLEELSEECRSAGRWVVMADPFSSSSTNNISSSGNSGGKDGSNTEGSQVHHFRRCINAGLALHGLASNADAFLPVSIDGAYNALHRHRGGNNHKNIGKDGDVAGGGGYVASPNRVLFEGSAAISMALEASTLFYRLRRQPPPPSSSSSSSSSGSSRSRIGIQSGFYQGYSGQSGGYTDEFDNEPYASAPALTYNEFLACARPSSDRRRSILELDALLCPITYPSAGVGSDYATSALSGGGGLNVASLLGSNVGGGGVSPAVMASLAAAGIIGGGSSGGEQYIGELQKRLMKGTSLERMRMEQQRQKYRSSRNSRSSSSRSNNDEPGEWLEDVASMTSGGLLSSLSGNATPFGRRSGHHHFALSTSLRPAASDARSFNNSSGMNSLPGGCGVSSLLRPLMESMGVKYRPEVSLGAVVKDSVSDLTGVGSYWRSVFTDRSIRESSSADEAGSGDNTVPSVHQQQGQKQSPSPRDIAEHSPVLSVLGNSTRSYPRLSSISSGFVDSLHSRRNMGYLSRDVMVGVVPEKDDCEEALEYCQELVDIYEPPYGSGLVLGEDENDDVDAYFDEES